MASSKQSKDCAFVIVPGSFCKIAFYDTLIAHLHEQGHDARAVELLSANDGTRQPAATMEDDAAHIKAAITAILDDESNPRDVVVLMHSYGGIPGSSALKGLSKADRSAQGKGTAVVGIVYMGSFIVPLGQSVRDTMGDAMPPEYKASQPGQYLQSISAELAPLIFNDLESPEEVAKYYSVMTRQSSDSFDGKLSYEAWKDIPSVQMVPEKDIIVPAQLQKAMYEQAVAAGGKITQIFLQDIGHAPNVSVTNLIAEEMVKLAERQ
ncbi:hypothetical protein DL770_004465 [Monosporascus sp. CRB-9-2]|nr:hypothetical protein DL770_004465 [Monosporascus sp. CRB-9-2]